MDTVKCSDCGEQIQGEVPRKPCPKCGSSRRTFSVCLSESLSVYDGLGFKHRSPDDKARRGVVAEGFTRYVTSRLARLVKHERAIDRREDRYFEKVTDVDTGKVLHECNESLSQHRGHGSAKARSNET